MQSAEAISQAAAAAGAHHQERARFIESPVPTRTFLSTIVMVFPMGFHVAGDSTMVPAQQHSSMISLECMPGIAAVQHQYCTHVNQNHMACLPFM